MSTLHPAYKKERYLYYWLGFSISYILPFLYFVIKLGFTQQVTQLVMPTIVVAVIGVIKLSSDIPKWISSWEPSIWKGLIKSIPKFVLFIALVTLGLTLKYIIDRAIDLAFATYFETVIVLFGGACVGSVFEALHLKYKELYLIGKGYVLGVVNK
jgi:hypothetical protein